MNFFIFLTAFCAIISLRQPLQPESQSLQSGMYAEIKTAKGKITLLLEFEKTPLTVANFVALAEGKMPNGAKPPGKPFYDGLKFHRVVKNFMIQGGAAENAGLGYTFRDEFNADLMPDRAGVLAMANAGPGTNESQFFITHVATPWLNNKHSIFGNVVEGQEVVDAIAQGDVMEYIKIIRIGEKAKKFDVLRTFNELNGKK